MATQPMYQLAGGNPSIGRPPMGPEQMFTLAGGNPTTGGPTPFYGTNPGQMGPAQVAPQGQPQGQPPGPATQQPTQPARPTSFVEPARDSMVGNWYRSYLNSGPGATTAAQAGPAAQAATTQWNVAPNQTVQGQLQTMLAQDSPLFRQAQARARQEANAMGVGRSSVAVRAGERALYDVAVPIATSDASMYGRAGEFNAGQENETARFNVGETNRGRMFDAEQLNAWNRDDADRRLEAAQQERSFEDTREREALGRAFTTSEREGEQAWRSGEAAADRTFTTSEREAGQRFAAGENRLGREHQTSERLGGERFAAGESAADRTFRSGEREAGQRFATGEREASQSYATGEREASQGWQSQQQQAAREHDFQVIARNHANELERLGFANNLATAQVPQQYAANVSQMTMAQVNSVLSEPNLDPEAKRAAVGNIVTYANNTLAWAESFFKVDLPDFQEPAAAPTNTGAAVAQPG